MTTKVHNRMLDSGYVNARDFGAKGDNVTDDTAALQQALDYAAANGKRVWLPSGDYRITDTLIIPAQGWLEGELHFFRGNNEASTIRTSLDIVAIQLKNFTLGHRLENIRVIFDGTYGDSTKAGIMVQNGDATTTSGMGSHFENIWVKNFDSGYWIEGWVWQQRYINCWSESHQFTGFGIDSRSGSTGQAATSAALIQFEHCSAITGDISTGAYGWKVFAGNVILDNPRLENNAYGIEVGTSSPLAPDATSASVVVNNGYFEGNRLRDVVCRYGSSFTSDYSQFIHQNAGQTTNAILFSGGDVNNPGSIIIQRAIIKANGGNDLQYLSLNEDNSHVFINDCEIQDLQNEMQISPYFSTRYSPRYVGFRQHGFEIVSIGGYEYFVRRIARSNSTSWTPKFDLDGVTYTVPFGAYWEQLSYRDGFPRRQIVGENFWYYLDENQRPTYYNNTGTIPSTINTRQYSGIWYVNFGTGDFTTTVDDSQMQVGESFFIADAFLDGGGTGATATINFANGESYTNPPGTWSKFRKFERSSGGFYIRKVGEGNSW